MVPLFPEGVKVVMFVTIKWTPSGKPYAVRKRLIKLEDVSKVFPMRDERQPVIGPNVYRELTYKEISEKFRISYEEAKQKKAANYFDCLEWACTISEHLEEAGYYVASAA